MKKNENPNVLRVIGNNITHIRKLRNMTQDELATKARINRTYIGYIENAKHNVTIGTLSLIATALEVEVSRFFE